MTANIRPAGNQYFYVTAADPAGPWSEPILVEQEGIDPSLFFDDDGQVYYTSTAGNGIHQCTIDPATGKILIPTRHIWPGSGGRYCEAPHLFKFNDFYYLLAAEGGTEYGHMATIARAKSPWGPFESCPRNPILTHRNRGGHPIQGTGHADFIQDHRGKWWAVFLAFRPTGGDFHHLGRETFLAPVEWQDDWPIIAGRSGPGTVEMEMEADLPDWQPGSGEATRDSFAQPQLLPAWNFLRILTLRIIP